MEFKIKPYPHQLEIYNMAKNHNNLALFWEMGCGKTFGVINILRYRYYDAGRVMKTLILTPLVTVYNWREEIMRFSNIKDSYITVLDCNGVKRNKMLHEACYNIQYKRYNQNQIIIMNYEALQTNTVFETLQEWCPEIVICDEMHMIKNHTAKRSKRTVKLGDKALYRYGLTGTPILNSISDIFYQYRFLDCGNSFGKSFPVFQNKYMVDRNQAWKSKQNYFPKWEPRPEKYPELQEIMYRIATRVTKKECLKDLPPLVEVKRIIELEKDQRKAYEAMKRDFVAFVDSQREQGITETVIAQLAITKALRLQQIASGFVVTDEGSTIRFKKNPKISITEEILKDLLPKNKVIIWCTFKEDYSMLEDMCKKMKTEYALLTGAQNIKSKQENMEKFRKSDTCNVIIANRRAGGIGVNLVEAGYSIVFSRDFSYGNEKQSEARNHRGGSEIHEKITKINLIAKDTIDEAIISAIDSKQNISNVVVDYR